MSARKNVRAAGVAGSFYPGDAERLARDVDSMIEDAAGTVQANKPVILLEPHAGYMYSGAVAAHGYKTLLASPPQTYVLIGPSHFERFDYTSVYNGEAYETPLGQVRVDQQLAGAIANDGPRVRLAHAGHVQPTSPNQEHGLEVQLPFIQRISADAQIVPIVMGDQSWPACEALARALAPVMVREGVVVVVSSDLSHFYSYDAAMSMDARFCSLLEAQDPRAMHDSIASGECEACGAGPMIAVLLANLPRKSACQVLVMRNSGDVTGDHSSVVGYASAVIYDELSEGGS